MTSRRTAQQLLWSCLAHSLLASLVCAVVAPNTVFAQVDQLLSVDVTNNALVSIDASTGQITTIGPLCFELASFGNMTFHQGILYAVMYEWGVKTSLLTIDPATGASCVIANVTWGGQNVTTAEGLATVNGELIIGFNVSTFLDGRSDILGVLALDGTISGAVDFSNVFDSNGNPVNADFDALAATPSPGGLLSVDTVPVSQVDLYSVTRTVPSYDWLGEIVGGSSGLSFDYIGSLTFSGSNLYTLGVDKLYRLDPTNGSVIASVTLATPGTYRGLVPAGLGTGSPGCTCPDCNGNGVPDVFDLSAGTSQDCNSNGVPDECEPDCQPNGVPDECDIAAGTSQDANTNGIPDECEFACEPAKMYWTDEITQTISRANLDGTGTEILFNLVGIGQTPRGIALDVQANRVYWTWFSSNGQPPGGISYGSMDGGPVLGTPVSELEVPGQLAIDLTNGRMYWTDWNGKVQRASLDGGCVEILETSFGPSGFESPSGIALDVANNDYYHGVYRFADPPANTIYFGHREPVCLGTGFAGPIRILQEVGPLGLALDLRPARRHIYWLMWPGPGLTGGKIQRADLNGTNAVTLIGTGLNGLTGIALDVDRNHMYFGEGFPQGTSIKRANLDGSGLIDITPPGFTQVSNIALDLSNLTGPDCNGNRITDTCEIASGAAQDCNLNGIPDECDIASGISQDANGDGIPDECTSCPPAGQPFFVETYNVAGDANDTPWSWCIRSTDASFPDLCDLFVPGVPVGGTALDVALAFADSINAARDAQGCANDELIAQALDVFGTVILSIATGGDSRFELWVGQADTTPDCQVVFPLPACGFNPNIDEIPLPGNDCNGNGLDDAMEATSGLTPDCNSNGIPDDCEFPGCPGILLGDMTCEGLVNENDIAQFIERLMTGSYICQADINGDGSVDGLDIQGFMLIVIGS